MNFFFYFILLVRVKRKNFKKWTIEKRSQHSSRSEGVEVGMPS